MSVMMIITIIQVDQPALHAIFVHVFSVPKKQCAIKPTEPTSELTLLMDHINSRS